MRIMTTTTTLFDEVKKLVGIEDDETSYDAELNLQIRTAISRLNMAGIKFKLGSDLNGKVITVHDFKVGNYKVGEIIPTEETDDRVLEFICVHVQRMLYQEAQTSFYSTLQDLEHELLTTMYYAEMGVDSDD